MEILEYMYITPEPAFTAGEIAQEIGYTAEGVRYKLEKMRVAGTVDRKKPGKRTVIYWITKKGRQHYAEHAG